ncbi:MAG: aminoacyl-tRNA hydrolase, partial [Gemmatimonadetes bacterium]|nr:aminoacyl-tRNA hydrolase [Gemmatimonadota bacterium]
MPEDREGGAPGAGADPHLGVVVVPGVLIPWAELTVRAITGSGPGGQHVNRSATRIVLTWHPATSQALSDAQRAHVVARLGSRLEADGTVRIVAGEHRSQQQNRRAALERLQRMVARALVVMPPRRPTRPTRGAVERR